MTTTSPARKGWITGLLLGLAVLAAVGVGLKLRPDSPGQGIIAGAGVNPSSGEDEGQLPLPGVAK